MRITAKKVNTVKFKPVEVNITIESPEEARTLFHVFNNGGLKKKMLTSWYSNGGIKDHSYSEDIVDLTGNDYQEVFSDMLENQGFEV